MNSENRKLRQEQRHEQQQDFVEQTAQQGQQFASVEDLLRYDNEQNPVPSEVAERLNRSIGAEPKPARPWYKSLFG
jgi:hypothetical protein